MSLMGVVVLVGIADSNSILIVEFTRQLRAGGMAVREAVAMACRVRLRPVLMTSLATIIGLLPSCSSRESTRRSSSCVSTRRAERFFNCPRASMTSE